MEIDRIVADLASRFVLAESNAAVVGCALVLRAGDGVYFGMFAVDPLRQAGGIGKALLAACEDAAGELWSAQAMTRSVISLRTDLIEWYGRRGYRRAGTSGPFPFP